MRNIRLAKHQKYKIKKKNFTYFFLSFSDCKLIVEIVKNL